MGFLLSAAVFHLITIGMFLATAYLLFVFTRAVLVHQHIPVWMYKISHVLKGRGLDSYENLTDVQALIEAYLFIGSFAVINIVCFLELLSKEHNVYEAAFLCFKQEFFLCVVTIALRNIVKACLIFIFKFINHAHRFHNYASTNAIIGMLFLSCFAQMLTTSMTGVPAKPYIVSVTQSRIVIGATPASELLQQGFSFEDADVRANPGSVDPEAMVVNQRYSNSFHYGRAFELTRNDVSYGVVYLTPQWTTTAKLKDCIVTSYIASSKDAGFDEVYLEGQQLSKLTWQSVRDRRLVDVFNLTPADYQEINAERYISLQLQTYPYMLWKSYMLKGFYNSDGEPDYFEIRTSYTLWE
ncbi:hypothetical protein [Atopobium fossor]|uniref:hypothetical protein n=1 Tax=Atopobium fossor TaxID=39487 RepID=UPI00040332C3|nr:hypothetical protein [Atopobium fossor]